MTVKKAGRDCLIARPSLTSEAPSLLPRTTTMANDETMAHRAPDSEIDAIAMGARVHAIRQMLASPQQNSPYGQACPSV